MQLRTIELGYTPDEVQDNRTLPNVSTQFKTFERSYMIQCVQDHQTLRCLSGRSGPRTQDSRTLLHISTQCESKELCYTFLCSSLFLNLAMLLNTSQDLEPF